MREIYRGIPAALMGDTNSTSRCTESDPPIVLLGKGDSNSRGSDECAASQKTGMRFKKRRV